MFFNLESGGDAGQVAWSAAKARDASLASFDLKANEATPGMEHMGLDFGDGYRGPQQGGQHIPTSRTAYHDYCYAEQAGAQKGWQERCRASYFSLYVISCTSNIASNLCEY